MCGHYTNQVLTTHSWSWYGVLCGEVISDCRDFINIPKRGLNSLTYTGAGVLKLCISAFLCTLRL